MVTPQPVSQVEALANDLLPADESAPPTIRPDQHNIAGRFHRGVFWSVAAAVLMSAFNFVLNIVLARLLGREAFGKFGMIQSTIMTAAGLGTLAMGYTATKFVAEFRASDPARAGRVIGTCALVAAISGSIAALVLYTFAPTIASLSLKAPELSGDLQIAAAIVFFSVLTGYQMGALAGLESYRSLAAAGLATGVVNLAGASVGAVTGGLAGAVAGLGVASAVQWVMYRWTIVSACRRAGIAINRHALASEKHLLFSFALPAALGGLSSLPALWVANAFVVRQPDGFTQMALYTAAFSLRSLVFFLPSLLNRVSMSLLNYQKGMRDWHGYGRVFRLNLLSSGVSVVLGAAVVAVVGPYLVGAFGKAFDGAYAVLLVLLLAAVAEAMTGSVYQIVQAESRMWSSIAFIMLPRDLLIVICAFVLVPRAGALGLASAYAIGWTVALITTTILVVRIGLRPPADAVASPAA